jgi:hypothetical protein
MFSAPQSLRRRRFAGRIRFSGGGRTDQFPLGLIDVASRTLKKSDPGFRSQQEGLAEPKLKVDNSLEGATRP